MRHYVCLPVDSVTAGDFSLITVQDVHIESIRQWRNAQIDVLRQSAPISPEQQVRYYAEQIWPTLDDPQPKNILVSFLERDKLVGYGGLVHIAWEHRRAEVSFLLETGLSADIATYSRYFAVYIGLIKKLAFERLSFHRLCTETYAIRIHHTGVLEKCGFILEGCLRDHVWIGGKYMDSLMHGCINEG